MPKATSWLMHWSTGALSKASRVSQASSCRYSTSGLLIAEVNVNTLCSLERDAVSITSMAAETIGEVGSNVCGAAYVFIHYALLVACALLPGPATCSRPALV